MTAPNLLASAQGEFDRPGATVFVVDDDTDVRTGIALLVRSVGLNVEMFSSGQEFLSHYDSTRPGCLILDVRMPDISGLEIQRKLRSSGVSLPIIFVTAHGEIPLVTAAMRAGAVDFIQKPFSPQALLERINEAIDRDRDLRLRQDQAHDVQHRMRRLTAREREVMELLAAGQSTKLIAQRLAISPKTVDNHRTKILEKMNVDNPTQLARMLSVLE